MANHKQEILLKLESYAEIFSYFDPRHYSKKALSEDFLSELRKASLDKEVGNIDIKLMVPSAKRNNANEILIKKRLREHFTKHYYRIKHKVKHAILKRGLIFIISGIILMLFATLLQFKYNQSMFATTFLIVLFVPAGWFFFWEGLNQVIFEAKKIDPELKFYEKMCKSGIHFVSY